MRSSSSIISFSSISISTIINISSIRPSSINTTNGISNIISVSSSILVLLILLCINTNRMDLNM